MEFTPELIEALVGAGGAGLSAYAGAKSSKEDRKLSRQNMIAQFLMNEGDDERAGATTALAALGGPYGAADALQKMKTKRDVLGTARNVAVAPPSDIAPYMGQVSGGLRIPEGGLDLSSLSDGALAEAARNYYSTVGQINPHGTSPNLQALGLGAPGASATASVEASKNEVDARNQARRDEIMRYLSGEQEVGGADQGDGGHGWLKTLAKIGGIAGPIAGMALGIPPVWGALLSGATGAASGAASGGTKGALLGGVTGAASGYLSGGGRSPFSIPRKTLRMSYDTLSA